MDYADLITQRIEFARQERGMSIAELARRCGIDGKRLWYVLRRGRAMRTDEFMQLCLVLGLGPQCFLTRAQEAGLRERQRRVAEEFGTGTQAPLETALGKGRGKVRAAAVQEAAIEGREERAAVTAGCPAVSPSTR